MANSPAFQPARTGTGSEAPILPISFGDEIGAGLVYSTGYGGSGAEDDSGHLGPGAAQFADGTPSYIGFALLREEDVFYGWMRVVLTRNGLDGLLQSWAYDDSGVAIRAAASADPGAAPVILQAGETQTATVATGRYSTAAPPIRRMCKAGKKSSPWSTNCRAPRKATKLSPWRWALFRNCRKRRARGLSPRSRISP